MLAAIPFPNLSPELFSVELWGFSFALRWYALAYIAGLVLGWRIVVALMRRPALWPGDSAPMTPLKVEDLFTYTILGVILGGRLGYVLFYQPGYFLAHPADILRVWEGGMAFHGGFAGVVIAGLIFCRRNGVAPMAVADAMAAAIAPGLFLGRLSNFVNGELWGRATDLPWGVIFPGAAAQNCGAVAGPCARHPSQLYEAGLEGLVLGLVIWWLLARRDALKSPGLLTGVFIGGYGLARFAVEFVRQPDLQFITPGNPLGLAWHIGGYGLTMGQLLSVPMIAIGLWLALRARRRAA